MEKDGLHMVIRNVSVRILFIAILALDLGGKAITINIAKQ